jgi:twitching motility protein PilI
MSALPPSPPLSLPGGTADLALKAALSAMGGAAASANLGNPAQLRHGLRVGKLNLLVGYADASALIERVPISRLPNTPHWFLGMANLRGNITPVYSIARYLHIENAADAAQMLLVVGTGSRAAAIQVDGTTELINTAQCARLDLQTRHRQMNKLGNFFAAAYQRKTELWFDFGVFDWLEHVGNELLH